MELTRLTANCTATVPSDVRRALGLRAGDAIEWKLVDGEARVRKARDADRSWARLSEAAFADEWLGPEDEAAWRDL